MPLDALPDAADEWTEHRLVNEINRAYGRAGCEGHTIFRGYPGIQRKGVIFNARAETSYEKKLFLNGIRYHRADIPAKNFYEWSVNREKNTFSRPDRRPLCLAGFFDVMENEERFVILTTQANDSMRRIHDRMPLVLEQDQIEDWVHDSDAAEKLLSQVPLPLRRQVDFEQMTLF